MGLLLFLCALVMAVVTCTPVATGAVTLSSDAVPIPGGYVVPERGNVTFTCSSSSGGALFWTVDLRIPGGSEKLTPSAGLDLPQVKSQDTSTLANPASFTVHNVTSENNQSFVECSKEGSGMSNATIIVEGSPNCPTVHTTGNTESFAVLIKWSLMMWLPEWYYVEVSYYNGSIAEVYNSTLKGSASFNVTSLQPGTVYNISVIPCNMAGCNKSCDVYSVQTMTREQGDASRPDFDITFTVIAAVAAGVVVLGMITGVGVIVVCTLKRHTNMVQMKGSPIKSGGGEGHYEDIVAVDPTYDDLVIMSTSFQDSTSSSVESANGGSRNNVSNSGVRSS